MQLQLVKKNIKTKMDVFECHFLTERPCLLAFQVSLVYEYFIFSPTKPRFDAFRHFSRFRPYTSVLRIRNTLYHPYIESTIALSYKLQNTRVKPYKECTQKVHVCGSSMGWPGRNVLATILKLSSFGAEQIVYFSRLGLCSCVWGGAGGG